MSFPRDFGGVLPWGASLTPGSRLLLPKQPTTSRLASLSFGWELQQSSLLSSLIFAIVYLDGAGNEVGRVNHDVLEFEFTLLSAQAEAIVSAGNNPMGIPTVSCLNGKITFGLSLFPLNIGKNISAPSGQFSPGEILSEHPLPWHMTTHSEEQVAVEFVNYSGSQAALPVVAKIVYRFSNF